MHPSFSVSPYSNHNKSSKHNRDNANSNNNSASKLRATAETTTATTTTQRCAKGETSCWTNSEPGSNLQNHSASPIVVSNIPRWFGKAWNQWTPKINEWFRSTKAEHQHEKESKNSENLSSKQKRKQRNRERKNKWIERRKERAKQGKQIAEKLKFGTNLVWPRDGSRREISCWISMQFDTWAAPVIFRLAPGRTGANKSVPGLGSAEKVRASPSSVAHPTPVANFGASK